MPMIKKVILTTFLLPNRNKTQTITFSLAKEEGQKNTPNPSKNPIKEPKDMATKATTSQITIIQITAMQLMSFITKISATSINNQIFQASNPLKDIIQTMR